MRIIIINDKENKVVSTEILNESLKNFFLGRKLDIDLIEVSRVDTAPCMGCFSCWIKTPGECVIKDKIEEINMKIINCDLVIYVTPIVFGQYGRNMKNVIDRGLHKVLPFFKKYGGRTVHPPRYDKYPVEYVIGCAHGSQKDGIEIFLDTHKKYRREIKKVYICERQEEISGILEKIFMEVEKHEKN